ncbi:hypothetical protein ACAG96_06165 [Candidatus Izemoplasma sp. B36]|uniref:hypothetical protein n=1 Tax=Candidatus Izemoplasma sp. B36 TaxID=3242468 RepID=UPI003556F1CA
MDKKDDKDIRKEIEELEKLIEQVKKQNEEERKKHQKSNKNPVIRINLASVYSNNFFINLIIEILVNFIVIFAMLKLFDFAEITDDINIIFIALIFTGLEQLYKRILLTKYLKIVLYTSGLIFTFMNLLIFYFLDLVIFQNAFSFVDAIYPIAFVVVFQMTRAVIKNIYLRIVHRIALKKIKKGR